MDSPGKKKVSDLRSRIKKDLERFSKLHLWYKELPLGGRNFILFPWKGQQPKNYINQLVLDKKEHHWHVWDASRIDEIPISGLGKDVIMRRSVIFNCFLWGASDSLNGERFIRGWSVLKQRFPEVKSYLRKKHKKMKIVDGVLLESHRQIQAAIKAADEIVSEMILRCPEWLGLPRTDLSFSDPTVQICRDNRRKNYTATVTRSSDGSMMLDIQRSPEMRVRTLRPKKKRDTISRKKRLVKRLSLREIPKLSLGPRKKTSKN